MKTYIYDQNTWRHIEITEDTIMIDGVLHQLDIMKEVENVRTDEAKRPNFFYGYDDKPTPPPEDEPE